MSPSACSAPSSDPSSFENCRQPRYNNNNNNNHHKDLHQNHTILRLETDQTFVSTQCLDSYFLSQPLVCSTLLPLLSHKVQITVFTPCRAGDTHGPQRLESVGPPIKPRPMHSQYNVCMRSGLCQRHSDPANQKPCCHLCQRQCSFLETSATNQITASKEITNAQRHHSLCQNQSFGKWEEPCADNYYQCCPLPPRPRESDFSQTEYSWSTDSRRDCEQSQGVCCHNSRLHTVCLHHHQNPFHRPGIALVSASPALSDNVARMPASAVYGHPSQRLFPVWARCR
ncbi:hypothetical protein ElyMa_006930600 [Elysia marginata]|uniref:Uncharacterized protein n=1 Tax=Elysia marginata TaxID=1093978 RepID=A0AAV4JFR3_9GAST|nr:hypothetical protein ElyMa_006930600 [Elysia marginata]